MYKRVGSNTWRRTTFRLVSATNRDLLQAASSGKFRQDLYYRLAGWSFRSPALSERRGDIRMLAHHFLGELYPGRAAPQLSTNVAELLRQRDYPGNVRDLRQLVARIATRHVGSGPITVGDLPREDRPESAAAQTDGIDFEPAVRAALSRGLSLKDVTQLAADTAVQVAMRDELWNVKRAAARLGVTDRALQLRRAAGRAAR
jgi:DNA-binding NtrC family response regulator